MSGKISPRDSLAGAERIVIGTRASALARAQTEQVARAIRAVRRDVEVETVLIQTRGDRESASPLPEIGGKGLFTAELEQALRDGRIDLAAHSLKDLPTGLPDGLAIGAVLQRADPRDVVVSSAGKLSELPAGSTVGTSSPRRRAQLIAAAPGLRVVEIRGNVDTRIRKMKEGACTALVLAAAGLVRLGLESLVTEYLPPEVMVPAPGQGIIAIEARDRDPKLAALLAAINHPPTWAAARAERAFLRRIGGGCRAPAGCLASIEGGRARLTGLLADPDGRRIVRETLSCDEADVERTAERLADLLLDRGGREIVERL